MPEPLRLFHARVGKRGDMCDQCKQTIPPHQMAVAMSDGRLICLDCKLTHFPNEIAK